MQLSSNQQDPRVTLNSTVMTRLQIMAVAMTVALNALDGFDVLAISFASPGIRAEWGLAPSGLGLVLTMELIGMAIGSILLGKVADLIGRRKTVMGCLVVMTIGMFMVTTTKSIVELSIWRVITGLGIGGMLAAINAIAAEFSNAKSRYLCISLMALGYPLGGVIGGSIATTLLGSFDWRVVFYFGTVVTAILLPLFYFLVPESIHWLILKRPPGALEAVNKTLVRMGHAEVDSLPDAIEDERKPQSSIFSSTHMKTTVFVALSYFLHITTFYFTIKWVPELVVSMGFSPQSAGGVLTWASVGGGLGAATFGYLTTRINLKILTVFALVFSAFFTGVFGQTPADLLLMGIFVACAGFFTNAAIVGLYAIMAQVFPTDLRASGTGFCVGLGRGGSIISPIIAGFLIQGGMSFSTIAPIMGIGALLSAVVLLFLKVERVEDEG